MTPGFAVAVRPPLREAGTLSIFSKPRPSPIAANEARDYGQRKNFSLSLSVFIFRLRRQNFLDFFLSLLLLLLLKAGRQKALELQKSPPPLPPLSKDLLFFAFFCLRQSPPENCLRWRKKIAGKEFSDPSKTARSCSPPPPPSLPVCNLSGVRAPFLPIPTRGVEILSLALSPMSAGGKPEESG